MQSKYLRTMVGALAFVSLTAGAQQKAPDVGPTEGLLSEAKPTFVVNRKDLPQHWTLIAYGDTRFTDPESVKPSNPKVRRWLVDKIGSEHPDSLIVTGDLPWHGVAADYAQFQAETSSWRAAKLRVYPVLGNHELSPNGTEGVQNWWAAFPALNHRRWYSVQLGEAYILALDSNLPLTTGSPEQAWVDAQLKMLPKQTRFVFVMLHHPPLADNGPHERHNLRPNEITFADYLNEKQKTLKARLIVVAGHTHNYERFQSRRHYLPGERRRRRRSVPGGARTRMICIRTRVFPTTTTSASSLMGAS